MLAWKSRKLRKMIGGDKFKALDQSTHSELESVLKKLSQGKVAVSVEKADVKRWINITLGQCFEDLAYGACTVKGISRIESYSTENDDFVVQFNQGSRRLTAHREDVRGLGMYLGTTYFHLSKTYTGNLFLARLDKSSREGYYSLTKEVLRPCSK